MTSFDVKSFGASQLSSYFPSPKAIFVKPEGSLRRSDCRGMYTTDLSWDGPSEFSDQILNV